MDSIAFTVSNDKDSTVQIVINGQNLIEILREVELPFATREGHPNIAGGYAGLSSDLVFLPSRHLLGEPNPLFADDSGRTYVLECKCGEPGCWPFATRVTLQDKEIVWSDFCQPHRTQNSKSGEWRYDALPSFRFDRDSYEKALSRTSNARQFTGKI